METARHRGAAHRGAHLGDALAHGARCGRGRAHHRRRLASLGGRMIRAVAGPVASANCDGTARLCSAAAARRQRDGAERASAVLCWRTRCGLRAAAGRYPVGTACGICEVEGVSAATRALMAPLLRSGFVVGLQAGQLRAGQLLFCNGCFVTGAPLPGMLEQGA